MRFLSFGDLNGRSDIIKKLLHLNLDKYDFLLYTGDTPDPTVFKHLRESKVKKGIDHQTDIEQELIKDTTPEAALQKALQEVKDICHLLEKIPVPVYGVLGNADLTYYQQFINWPFNLLHNQITKINNYDFIGYDGRPLYQFETENRNERAFAEAEIKSDLTSLFSKVNPKKTVLVTHAPPYMILDQVDEKMRQYAVGTYGEKAQEGHIGSTGLKSIVETYKPLLHIFSHIHEAAGIVKKETSFVNLGSTGETNQYLDITLKADSVNIERCNL